jgi:hypothetical protein
MRIRDDVSHSGLKIFTDGEEQMRLIRNQRSPLFVKGDTRLMIMILTANFVNESESRVSPSAKNAVE